MAVLTEKQLRQLNYSMLSKGMSNPNIGYSNSDYNKMKSLYYVEHLTDRQLWYTSLILSYYSTTHLKQYANDISESVAYYGKLSTTSQFSVRVLGKTDTHIQLSWKYNKNVSDMLKTKLDKKMFFWRKLDTGWVLFVEFMYLDTIISLFENNGFDCSKLKHEHFQYLAKLSNSQLVTISEKIKFTVQRLPRSVDTLTIKSEMREDLPDLFRKLSGAVWSNTSKFWTIPIEQAGMLYDLLPDNIDGSELKPWADLVNSWNSSYTLIDWRRLSLPFIPYEFQPTDAEFLLKIKRGLNGNEVGCGKTFEQVLIGESIPMKKLVICPATLRLNWKREILMVNPHAKIQILYSDKPFKVVNGWNIISYNSVVKFLPELEKELFQVVMADEAHYVQAVSSAGTPCSKRAFAVLRLAATAQYVYPITGTPKTNCNKNLYNILRMIRHPLTRGKRAFFLYSTKYCDAHETGYGWNYNGNSNDINLNEQLNTIMVRHLKKEVLPFLQKQRQAIPVEVDLIEYNRLIDEYLEKRGRSRTDATDALVALNRAKQVIALQKTPHTIAYAKDILEIENKVVIVTCYTDVVKKVESAFGTKCLKIVGGMSDVDKQNAIDQFQTDPKIRVMVINIVAGGVGITLTSASSLILNDFPWVVGHIEQAEGRIWRAGQSEVAKIYFMTAAGCPMDEKLIDIIVYKSQTINAVVDGGMGSEINLRQYLENALWKKCEKSPKRTNNDLTLF